MDNNLTMEFTDMFDNGIEFLEYKAICSDGLFLEACKIMMQKKFINCSLLQDKMSISWSTARRIICLLEEKGVVSSVHYYSYPPKILVTSWYDLLTKLCS